MRKVKKRLKITKFERFFIFAYMTILVIASPVAVVFTKAALSQINYEVEKVNKEIATQEKEKRIVKHGYQRTRIFG